MSISLANALVNFFRSLTSIGISLFTSILAVFQAILALFQQLLQNVIELFQALIKLGLEVSQGIFGLVTANFFVLAIIGGAYYWYTKHQKNRGLRKTRK